MDIAPGRGSGELCSRKLKVFEHLGVGCPDAGWRVAYLSDQLKTESWACFCSKTAQIIEKISVAARTSRAGIGVLLSNNHWPWYIWATLIRAQYASYQHHIRLSYKKQLTHTLDTSIGGGSPPSKIPCLHHSELHYGGDTGFFSEGGWTPSYTCIQGTRKLIRKFCEDCNLILKYKKIPAPRPSYWEEPFSNLPWPPTLKPLALPMTATVRLSLVSTVR